ncbi:hypothetical protein FB107DRAFT_209569 [Schizophyllum commune]
MTQSGPLPPELWLEIFDWCFSSPTCQDVSSDEYTPFQALHDDRMHVRTTAAVSLVCRQWRALTVAILYRDVHILPSSAHALRDALCGSACGGPEGYGQWVRRVVLPYTSTITRSSAPLQAVEILKRCPRVEVLVRPRYATSGPIGFEFEADMVPFHTLRRLDWWGNSEAERSGGLNSLGNVLAHAPGLRYLFIGGIMGLSPAGMQPPELVLPNLVTLRLNVINGLLMNKLCTRWSLPELRHLVLDSPLVGADIRALWDTFGQQLTTVEFGAHARFVMTDMVTPCLRACPNIREFNYHVFFTTPPDPDLHHDTLEVVGLHGAADQLIGEGQMVWTHFRLHLGIFTQDNFPSLRRIVLAGDEWRTLSKKPGFLVMLRDLSRESSAIRDLLVY